MKKILILMCCLTLIPMSTKAQQTQPNPTGNPTANLSGQQLVQGLLNGNLNLNQAATNFSQQANIPFTDALQILQNIQQLPQAAQAAAGNLVNNVIQQNLPPNIAQTLSTLNTLGQLTNINNISQVFQNPQLLAQLQNLAPAQLQQTLGTITGLMATAQALQNLSPQAIMNAVMSALPASLANLLSGVLNLSGFLNGLFGGGGSIVAGSAGPSGSYEIFPAVRNRGPVSKSCTPICNCSTCRPTIENNHGTIRAHMTDSFIVHRTWLIDEFFVKQILPAMALMTAQLNTMMMQQAFIIGTFFDAKHQLETQRLFQQLMAEAHKDYQPSEGICDIGTNVRSLAASTQKSKMAHATFSSQLLARSLRNGDTAAGSGEDADVKSRMASFITNYCNPADNSNGLNHLCSRGGTNAARYNKDVDFTNTLESKLTLDIDFTGAGAATGTPDEEDIFALTSNLFGHIPLDSISGDLLADNNGFPYTMAYRYLDLRSLAAKRNVAQNAFSAIVADRAKGDPESAQYLKRLVADLGVPQADIDIFLGQDPSYFAQMEVLTKSIYQNPVFYTELYDKPANVLRKQVALAAIRSMQERDMFENQLQIESVFASIGEEMLRGEFDRIEAQLISLENEGDQ